MSHLLSFIDMHTKLGMPQDAIMRDDFLEASIYLNLTNDIDRSIFYLGMKEYVDNSLSDILIGGEKYNVDQFINWLNELTVGEREEIRTDSSRIDNWVEN